LTPFVTPGSRNVLLSIEGVPSEHTLHGGGGDAMISGDLAEAMSLGAFSPDGSLVEH